MNEWHPNLKNLSICWIGGTRYTNPLDATQDKKWRLLRKRLESKIFVISFARGIRPQYFAPHANFYLLSALPFALLRYTTMYMVCPLLLLWLIARRRVRIIIAHDPYFGLIGAVAKRVARLFGVRVALVIESHADFEAVFLQRNMPFATMLRRIMHWAARQSLRQADALRAVSSNTRAQLAEWSPKPLYIHQFLTWTDLDTFTHVIREKRPSQSPNLIYVGVLIPRKGVHLLLDAFAGVVDEFPESHLWLVGSADNPQYAANLVEQAKRLGIAERVTFVGHLPQSELASYLGSSRALVLPSSSEGLPRVVIEAMLSAVPVVATNVSGIPDVIRDGVNGYLVPPDDVPALEKALRTVLQMPSADIDRMGKAGHDDARNTFSTETYMAGYMLLISAAVKAIAQ